MQDETFVVICTYADRDAANRMFGVLGLRAEGFDLPLSPNGLAPATHFAAQPAELAAFSEFLLSEMSGKPTGHRWSDRGLTREDVADLLAAFIISVQAGDADVHLEEVLEHHGLRVVESPLPSEA